MEEKKKKADATGTKLYGSTDCIWLRATTPDANL